MRANWRKVQIPLYRPGEPVQYGMSILNVPAGTMDVYKAFCPQCGGAVYRKMEMWYCPECRLYLEEAKHENQ